MGILAWLLIGLIAGFLAEQLTDRSMGLLANIVVGIVGAFLGGFLFNLFGGAGITGFNLYSLLVATVGAILLLFILGAVRRTAH